MPTYDEFFATAEQLMMTNAGRPMPEVIDQIAVALMDAFAQGYQHARRPDQK
jgi:hypothetical protein